MNHADPVHYDDTSQVKQVSVIQDSVWFFVSGGNKTLSIKAAQTAIKKL